MSFSGSADRMFNGLLTVAALTIAGTLVYKQFGPGTVQASVPTMSSAPVKVPNWNRLLSESRVGATHDAPVAVVVFTDFQCPACRKFHGALNRLRGVMPDTFAVRYIHYPLEQHAQAPAAAALFECTRHALNPDSLATVLYAAQDSLGIVSWVSLAQRVEPTILRSNVERCMQDSTTTNAVRSQITLGEETGVMYTPTILVNGWKLNGTPSTAVLARQIRAAAKKTPLDDPSTIAPQ